MRRKKWVKRLAELEFDTSELDKWEKKLMPIIERDIPKEFKKVVRQSGNLLRRKARQNTPKISGDLRKSYRVYMKRGSNYEVDVGTKKYYAKMVEEGHKGPNGKGFVQGKWYFKKAFEETEKELPKHLKQSIRRIGRELGFDVW